MKSFILKFAPILIITAALFTPAFAIDCPTQSGAIQDLIAGKPVKKYTKEQIAACKAQKEEEKFYEIRMSQAREAQAKQEWANYLNSQGVKAHYNSFTGIVETERVSPPVDMTDVNLWGVQNAIWQLNNTMHWHMSY